MSKPTRSRPSAPAAATHRAGVRRTPSDKAKLLELLDRDFVSGMTVADVAKKHSISTASYYRWQRERNIYRRSEFADLAALNTNVTEAIEIICRDDSSPLSMIESVFRLLAWIRWPNERERYTAAIVNCIASYLRQNYTSTYISDLSADQQKLIDKYLTLDAIFQMSSPESILNPSFEIITNQKSRYDDRQFFAQITNYLLSDPIKVGRKSHRPSLGKLEQLVSENAFGRDWSMSPRTFNKHWRQRAPSCPFLYVEHYHSSFDLSLNPLDIDFADSVDHLVAQRSNFRLYLGKVKWVIMELRRTLDTRAVRHITFPAMPDTLEPLPLTNPPVDRRLQAKCAQIF